MRRLLSFGTILACGVLLAGAQQVAQLDFFAPAGHAEYDFDRNGRADEISFSTAPEINPAHFHLSLDYQSKYEGTASQRVVFQRSDGAAGWASLLLTARFNAFLKPEVGEAILVRFALRAEGFQNATYSAFVTTGSQRAYIIHPRSEPTNGWQQFSMVVPVETNAQGQPVFSLTLMIEPRAGAASGTIWLDDVRAVSTRTVMRPNTLPNGLKIVLVNPQHDLYLDLPNLPVGLTVGSPRHEAVFRRHYPNTLSAPYVFFSGTVIAPNARHNRDIYNYDDLDQNHPNWFLRNAAGERMMTADGVAYYVDVGLPQVRERAWQSLRDFILRMSRPRYVFFDDVDMRVGVNAVNYGNINVWAQTVVDALNYLGSRLQSEFGATIIPNVAWSPAFWLRGMNGGADAPGVATLPYMGGFLIEHAFTHARTRQNRTAVSNYGTTQDLNNWQVWALRDQIRIATEYPDKLTILHPTYVPGLTDTPQRIRFAIAGCLIVQHENTYVEIEPRGGSDLQYPDGFYPPELFVPLGRWTENYRILNGDLVSGGLFVRNYENGIVVFNPTHNRDFTFTVPRDLYDWDRNLIRAGTVVPIPRQTGHVFYSAPEIALEISPQNTQVLPGQTVQFTVTYRNRGTAPGTDVRIAVPLPQGMTLVGSNPAARLENGQVVWSVPNVPVGGQGTLQFTVRVE